MESYNMNRVRVPTRYLAEHHTPIEQVEILIQKLLQFEISVIKKGSKFRAVDEMPIQCCKR